MDKEILITANTIRKKVLSTIHRTKSSHIGSCFSIVDILTVLYFRVLNINPLNIEDPQRDIFVLSKGHACVALYATLVEKGFCSESDLQNYVTDGSKLAGHAIKGCIPGVEVTAGSLGHGLSIAAGMAMANRKNDRKFFCLLGDGECNEGSVWEAALFAAHNKFENLIAIIDNNKQQGMGNTSNILSNETLGKRWESFGWKVVEVDGHDLGLLEKKFKETVEQSSGCPTVVIAHTVKGKGVSWMENTIDWHYKSPDEKQYADALKELETNV